MRRVMFTGSLDWGNWHGVRAQIDEEFALAPFIGVHRPTGEFYYVTGRNTETKELRHMRVGSVDAYVEEYCRQTGIWTSVAEFDPAVDHVHAFPGVGDQATVEVMAQALDAGIPVTNHGYQPATKQARYYAKTYP